MFVSPIPETEPPHDCARCPRLLALRNQFRQDHPSWWNAPVPAFGDEKSWLVIVGLAPGAQGANRTGRPFTGDYAGELLFDTLAQFGFTRGTYQPDGNDDFELLGVTICNTVKCLPPSNKPLPVEVSNCRLFLERQIGALVHARIYVALGRIAHQSLVKVLGGRPASTTFRHLADHSLPGGRLIDSYHCSRYNQNTGRLTRTMFEAVFARAIELRDEN